MTPTDSTRGDERATPERCGGTQRIPVVRHHPGGGRTEYHTQCPGCPDCAPPSPSTEGVEAGLKCCFPSCRCEWSKRHEHCPRFGGTTYGYEETRLERAKREEAAKEVATGMRAPEGWEGDPQPLPDSAPQGSTEGEAGGDERITLWRAWNPSWRAWDYRLEQPAAGEWEKIEVVPADEAEGD